MMLESGYRNPDQIKLCYVIVLHLLFLSMSAESQYDFDFFVIGGGSGGLAAAKAAATLGAKTGLADFVKPSPAGTSYGLGGTCVNVGCIPKKLLHIAAHRLEVIKEASEFGLASSSSETEARANWEKLIQSVNMYIRKLNWNYKTELRDNQVTYYNAFAKFIDKHTLELTNKAGEVQRVSAKYILIACGGRPSLGGYPGAEENCISSDDIFWKKSAPGSTLVVGASYIALESAGFLNGLGFQTTVMVRSILLRGFDQDVAGMIGKSMERMGVKFEWGLTPSRFEKNPETGKVKVFVPGENGQGALFGEFDTVLMAVGRNGCAKQLNLEAAGVMYKQTNGKIYASNDDRTNVDNIFALGDVVDGRMELTPPAIMAGKLLAERLFAFATQQMDYNNIPTTVFTPVEYGCVGLSEDQAKATVPYATVYHRYFKPLEHNLLHDRPDDECYMKVITEPKEGRIVGMHYLGPNAGEVIQGFAAAIKAGVTKEHLDSTIGIHPTSAEWFVQGNLNTVKQEGAELTTGGGC
jgi:thioredoxin/glutathione reductase (selenoprotein)